MLDKILDLIADKLSWGGLNYTWDIGTNNTADTWVPVLNSGKIEHRVIPAQLGTKATLTIGLANSNVMTLTESRVYAYQMNPSEYLVCFHVQIQTTQARTNLAAWRFMLNGSPATQYTPGYIIHRQSGNNNAYMSWINSDGWVMADNAWNANTSRTWGGSCIVKF